MTENDLNRLDDREPHTPPDRDERDLQSPFIPGPDWQTLYADASYSAHAQDLDFLWRWVIVREGDIIQEGCSLSYQTAARSVQHVLAFYANSRDRPRGAERAGAAAIQTIIKESY